MKMFFKLIILSAVVGYVLGQICSHPIGPCIIDRCPFEDAQCIGEYCCFTNSSSTTSTSAPPSNCTDIVSGQFCSYLSPQCNSAIIGYYMKHICRLTCNACNSSD